MKTMKDNMRGMKNGLKADMGGLKEASTQLLQEMLPSGKKVLHIIHDEKKRNVNHDFINSNVGWKTHHIPKINMRKLDGKDPVTWILQMEQYFDLINVKNTQKVRIATLYLEKNTFVQFYKILDLILQRIFLGLRTFLGGTFKGHILEAFIIFSYFHTFGLILQRIFLGLKNFLGGTFKRHFLEVCDTVFWAFFFNYGFGLNFERTFFGFGLK